MRFFSRVFLPFLLLGYIAVETYLKFQNTSLCGEVGCKLAGELLKFNPIYLHYFGLVSVFILVILGARSLKSTLFETLYFMVLYAAIAFETTILGYQFLANPEPCIFCLGVFSSLLLIALFSHFKNFIIILAAILAVYIALNTLNIPKNKAYVTQPGNYLIQSDTCPHCIKVKTYFENNNISYIPIPSKEVNARGFLKFIDIKSIPVLIIKEASSITLIKGDKKIIAYFEEQKTEEAVTPEVDTNADQSSTLELSSDFLSQGPSEDCALTITEAPSCEDDNATPTSQH
jgi:glutaredoxin